MASYGSAIVLCGIIAAFAVHQVFRWLQKRADLHGIETRRYRALLARQTPGHCNNRGFRLDLRNVHHRPRDPPRGHHPELKGVEQRHRQLRPAGCQVGDQDPDLGRITAAASRA